MKISQNTKEVSIVELGRSRDKLTQDVDRVSDVRTGDPKVNKAPNKLTIARVRSGSGPPSVSLR